MSPGFPNSGKIGKSCGPEGLRAAPSSTAPSSSRRRLRPVSAPTEPNPPTPRSAAPKASISASSAAALGAPSHESAPATAPDDHPATSIEPETAPAGSIRLVIGAPGPSSAADTSNTAAWGAGPAPARMANPDPWVPSRFASSRENRTAAACPSASTRTATKATTSSNDTRASSHASATTSCVPRTIPIATSRDPPTT